MSLVKKSDVKNHLRPPFLTKMRLRQPESQPDATGFSVAEPDADKAKPSIFAEDFVAEHLSPGASIAPADPAANSIRPVAATAQKSAQG